MVRARGKLRKWTAKILDLPQDVVLDLSRMTLIGGQQLLIENHRGVLHFSGERLKLAMDKGEVEVTGENLVIRQIGVEDVLVEGKITGLQLT